MITADDRDQPDPAAFQTWIGQQARMLCGPGALGDRAAEAAYDRWVEALLHEEEILDLRAWIGAVLRSAAADLLRDPRWGQVHDLSPGDAPGAIPYDKLPRGPGPFLAREVLAVVLDVLRPALSRRQVQLLYLLCTDPPSEEAWSVKALARAMGADPRDVRDLTARIALKAKSKGLDVRCWEKFPPPFVYPYRTARCAGRPRTLRPGMDPGCEQPWPAEVLPMQRSFSTLGALGTVFTIVCSLMVATLLAGSLLAETGFHPISASTGDCTNTVAVPTGGGGHSATAPTQTCDSGESCGYILTYNPLVTECKPSQGDKCCVEQEQQSYTQNWSCQPDPGDPDQRTICQGGAKNYMGPMVTVFVTVECDIHEKCEVPGTY